MNVSERNLKTLAQAAKILSVSVRTAWEWANHGAKVNGQVVPLRHSRAGSRYRFTQEQLEEFLRDRQVAGQGRKLPAVTNAQIERDRLAFEEACRL